MTSSVAVECKLTSRHPILCQRTPQIGRLDSYLCASVYHVWTYLVYEYTWFLSGLDALPWTMPMSRRQHTFLVSEDIESQYFTRMSILYILVVTCCILISQNVLLFLNLCNDSDSWSWGIIRYDLVNLHTTDKIHPPVCSSESSLLINTIKRPLGWNTSQYFYCPLHRK